MGAKRFCVFPMLAMLAALQARAGDWHLPEYRYRRRIVIETCPSGSAVAHARFSHHGTLKPDAADIRVVDADGKPLRHELLRNGPGDQVEILFEAPGAKQNGTYTAYFGNANASAPVAWKAEAGVVLEARKRTEGDGDNWNNFQKMFGAAKEVYGRTLRPKIFDGYNCLGPSQNYITYYRAYFRAEKSGTYRFATNSDDASFLHINGKLVAEYPGWHGAGANIGQHNGAVELTAGTHKLEYYHVNGDGDGCTVAAWQRPGERHFVLMEDADFLPIARAKTGAIEQADGRPLLDFFWHPRDHVVVQGKHFIRYKFLCGAAVTGDLKWDFGDGTTAITKKEKEFCFDEHLFMTPGTYTVTLTREGAPAAPVKQTVVVEPVWAQREEFSDAGWKEIYGDLVARLEKGTLRPPETAVALTYALALDNHKLLELSAALAWKQAAQFSAADHDAVFYKLGHSLQSELKDFAGSERAFLEVIRAAGDEKLKEQAKLHRAGLLIHILGKNQEGFDVLKNLDDAKLLAPNEPVLRQIYMADACAGLGQREEAVKRYESLRPIVNLADRAYAVGRRGRLLAINTYIRRNEFEAAMQELRNIEWETPLERMSDETGLLRVECYLEQKDFQQAVVLLQRLIKVNATSGRLPEMLFSLLKAYRGMNRTDEMNETFAKLKKEHPYAAETALAAVMMGK